MKPQWFHLVEESLSPCPLIIIFTDYFLDVSGFILMASRALSTSTGDLFLSIHFPCHIALSIVCVCLLSHFCHACLFVTPWTPWSPQGSSVHGIIQARILERVAIPSSRGLFQPRDQTCIFCDSCIAGRLFTIEPPRKSHSLWYICIFCCCCCCRLM